MTERSATILRDAGLSVTAQRMAMLRAISARPHATADELAEVARSEIGAISRQAAYDALAAMVARGLIRRIQPAGSAARYEDRVDDNHHHLVCRSCGALADVDCAIDATPCLTPQDDAGFEIEEAEVVYWGRCPRCQDASGDDVTAAPEPSATAPSPSR
ncbi:Fur family transcriptional regulator [Ilumatobacter sp.]|uniref:Fur family transcriptional regulator n=1 Tax=Ilumatobacter sp. TaxID=1967498 RepID=UPI003B51ED97